MCVCVCVCVCDGGVRRKVVFLFAPGDFRHVQGACVPPGQSTGLLHRIQLPPSLVSREEREREAVCCVVHVSFSHFPSFLLHC